MLQELLRCLGIDGFAPFPSSINSDYLNPNVKGGLGQAAAPVDLPTVPPPRKQLSAADLLPTEQASAIQEFNIAAPIGEGILQDINSLKAGYHIGIDTVGQTLRNANRQVRSEPSNPQIAISPFMNSTIAPDLMRKPFELGSGEA